MATISSTLMTATANPPGRARPSTASGLAPSRTGSSSSTPVRFLLILHQLTGIVTATPPSASARSIASRRIGSE